MNRLAQIYELLAIQCYDLYAKKIDEQNEAAALEAKQSAEKAVLMAGEWSALAVKAPERDQKKLPLSPILQDYLAHFKQYSYQQKQATQDKSSILNRTAEYVLFGIKTPGILNRVFNDFPFYYKIDSAEYHVLDSTVYQKWIKQTEAIIHGGIEGNIEGDQYEVLVTLEDELNLLVDEILKKSADELLNYDGKLKPEIIDFLKLQNVLNPAHDISSLFDQRQQIQPDKISLLTVRDLMEALNTNEKRTKEVSYFIIFSYCSQIGAANLAQEMINRGKDIEQVNMFNIKLQAIFKEKLKKVLENLNKQSQNQHDFLSSIKKLSEEINNYENTCKTIYSHTALMSLKNQVSHLLQQKISPDLVVLYQRVAQDYDKFLENNFKAHKVLEEIDKLGAASIRSQAILMYENNNNMQAGIQEMVEILEKFKKLDNIIKKINQYSEDSRINKKSKAAIQFLKHSASSGYAANDLVGEAKKLEFMLNDFIKLDGYVQKILKAVESAHELSEENKEMLNSKITDVYAHYASGQVSVDSCMDYLMVTRETLRALHFKNISYDSFSLFYPLIDESLDPLYNIRDKLNEYKLYLSEKGSLTGNLQDKVDMITMLEAKLAEAVDDMTKLNDFVVLFSQYEKTISEHRHMLHRGISRGQAVCDYVREVLEKDLQNNFENKAYQEGQLCLLLEKYKQHLREQKKKETNSPKRLEAVEKKIKIIDSIWESSLGSALSTSEERMKAFNNRFSEESGEIFSSISAHRNDRLFQLGKKSEGEKILAEICKLMPGLSVNRQPNK